VFVFLFGISKSDWAVLNFENHNRKAA